MQRAVFANTAARIGSRQTWEAQIATVRAGGMEAVREATLARFLSADYRQKHPETVSEVEAMLLATDPRGYIAACDVLCATDLHELVPTIAVPSLILAGELDATCAVPRIAVGNRREPVESLCGSRPPFKPRISRDV